MRLGPAAVLAILGTGASAHILSQVQIIRTYQLNKRSPAINKRLSEQEKTDNDEKMQSESTTQESEHAESKTSAQTPAADSTETKTPDKAETADAPAADSTETKTPDAPAAAEPAEKATQRRDIIFVGSKPIMTYVHATLTQIASNPTVTIKARGKKITHAVDVSQMIVKRMDAVGYYIKDVRIASDFLMSEDGKQRNISTIEIDISSS